MKTTSFSYKLQSRPGQLLIDHLMNTARLCSAVREKRLSTGFEDSGEIFGEAAWRIGFTHDLGKATAYFQEYLEEKDESRKASLKNKSETHHSLLSSLFTYRILADYLISRDMPGHSLYGYLPILGFLAVKRHHGNPINFKDELLSLKNDGNDLSVVRKQLMKIDQDEFDQILQNCPQSGIRLAGFAESVESLMEKDILKEEKKKWRAYCKNSSLDLYLLFQFLYSALLSADKSDAIGIEGSDARPLIPGNLVDAYRKVKFKDQESANRINGIRNEIYEKITASARTAESHHRIFSINVPTGTGKTLTGLSFALKLRERIAETENIVPKIIYCLPFLSIIEQNFSVFDDVFQKVTGKKPDNRILLKHHHLAEIVFKTKENEELPPEESRFFIEGWESEIVVTTFMQLFHTIISNKNRMLRKFNAMVNAIVILDEIQTIPYKYWHLVRNIFLRFSEMFNTRFILMTATQPLIFKQGEMIDLIPDEDKKRYFESLDRITFVNQSQNELRLKEFVHILEDDIENYPDDDFLVVLNTINASISVFDSIKKYVKNQKTDIELYYLSTNIIPKHRLERIENIKKSGQRKIVVSTQLVEAGVDIDMDRVYRDFAPFDSLNQVAGRCNRNFSKGRKGVVTVFSLLPDENGRAFYRYIYGKGDLSIVKTKDVLADKTELTEREFLESGMEYFRILRDAKADDEADRVLGMLSELNFATVCEDKDEKFRLIDSEYPTRDLFIELDEEASEVWGKFRSACKEKDLLERKAKISRLKKAFFSYVISVPLQKASGEALGDTEIIFINSEQLETTYKHDTGFIRKKDIQFIL